MIPIIDADCLLYTAAYSAVKTVYQIYDHELDSMLRITSDRKWLVNQMLEEGAEVIETSKEEGPLSHAQHNLMNMLDRISNDLGSDDVHSVYVITGNTKHPNYREAIAKTPGPHGQGYKAGRASRPTNYRELKQWFIKRYDPEIAEGMEGDDICAMIHYDDPNTILATNDKDLDTVVGYKYNLTSRKIYYVDEHTANVNYWSQMLTGDIADNIPGVKGIGKTQSARLIGDETDPNMMQGLVQLIYQHEECLRKLFKCRSNVKQRILDQINQCDDCELTEAKIDRINEVAALLYMLRDQQDSAPRFDRSLSIMYNYNCRDGN